MEICDFGGFGEDMVEMVEYLLALPRQRRRRLLVLDYEVHG